MTCPAKFNLMQSLLTGENPATFQQKVEELENDKKCISCRMHQCGIQTHFSKEPSADADALLAKGLSVQSDDHQQVLCALASAK